MRSAISELRLRMRQAACLVVAIGLCGVSIAQDTTTDEAVADAPIADNQGLSVPSEGAKSEGAKSEADAEEKGGISESAEVVGHVFGLPISNSMVVMWVVSIGIIVLAQLATRDMQLVPSGLQNFVEWLVESLRSLLADLLGDHLVDRTFWFFASTFVFILLTNWSGMVPGMGSIGWGHVADGRLHIDEPLLRAPNADLNMTMAMSLVFFACWFYWALSEHGLLGFLKERFGPKGDSRGIMGLAMAVVFFAVGCLEIISILFRPVSLSFRLYGNIFAGDNILEVMGSLVPGLGWLLPVPFYFMELLVGLIQALVFMMLAAVFTLLDCRVDEGEEAAAT